MGIELRCSVQWMGMERPAHSDDTKIYKSIVVYFYRRCRHFSRFFWEEKPQELPRLVLFLRKEQHLSCFEMVLFRFWWPPATMSTRLECGMMLWVVWAVRLAFWARSVGSTEACSRNDEFFSVNRKMHSNARIARPFAFNAFTARFLLTEGSSVDDSLPITEEDLPNKHKRINCTTREQPKETMRMWNAA